MAGLAEKNPIQYHPRERLIQYDEQPLELNDRLSGRTRESSANIVLIETLAIPIQHRTLLNIAIRILAALLIPRFLEIQRKTGVITNFHYHPKPFLIKSRILAMPNISRVKLVTGLFCTPKMLAFTMIVHTAY